jgi:hypothetical protein
LFRRVLLPLSLGLAMLAGCGPLNPGTITTGTTNANLRVLNGSPNQTVTAQLDSATGATLATNLAYASVAPFQQVSAVNHSVVITSTTSAFTQQTCGIGVLQPGGNYTVVFAGKANQASSSIGLQCQVFLEPAYAGTSSVGNFSLHNASPAANANGYTTLTIGTYPYTGATPSNFGSTIGSSPPFNSTAGVISSFAAGPLAINSSTTGIGFWVTPQGVTPAAGSANLATFLPSTGIAASSGQPVTTDPTNLFPTSNLVNLSIYAVDSASGSVPFQLVGIYEGI